MLHKNFEHTLERLELFLNGKSYSKDQEISIDTQFYSEKVPVKSLKVIRNTGRVKPTLIAEKLEEFTEDAKIGDVFGKSWDTHWFLIDIEIPESWLDLNKEVHLIWNSKCEAALYTIDGRKLLQAFTENVREKYVIKRQGVKNDFVDHEINQSGLQNRIQYLLEMACNEMFGNFKEGFNSQVDMNKRFILEKCEIALFNRNAWNLYFNFELLRDGAKEFEKSQSSRAYDCLMFANQIMNECYPPFKEEGMVEQAEERSTEFIECRKNNDQQHTVYAVGHCHIDTAWLWPYAETKRKIARSWSTQIELMKHYQDFKFCASQVGQYHWLKQNYPEVFERVKEAINEARFEVVGGTWVELDGNVPSGEAMIRQFLYGQRFLKEEFGSYATVFFMPDTFGYSPQLPQIMKSAGIKYFLTQKLSWSVFNKFPHSSFYWRGIDGTEVLTHFPPADTYNSNGSLKEVLMSQTNFKDKGRSNTSLLLFGDGDGGGGPQIEHLERLTRLQDFDGVPKVKFGTVKEFFEVLEQESKNLMKWYGELYLELHNGTYTSVSDIKKYNRQMEIHLRDVEIISTYAALIDNDFHYDVEMIRELWHIFLIDQFHDVLPGTCIGMVYEDIKLNSIVLKQKSCELFQKAFKCISKKLLNGCEIVEIQDYQPQYDSPMRLIYDKQAALLVNTLPFDRLEYLRNGNNVQGHCMIQGMGMALVDAKFLQASLTNDSLKLEGLGEEGFKITNRYYTIIIGREGRISNWLDKRTKNFHREICKEGDQLNKLVLHQDVPFFWDAWDVMHHDFETGIDIQASECCIESQTIQRIRIQFSYQIKYAGNVTSTISQIVAFYNDTPRVDFITQVKWNEAKKILKVYFPLNIRSDFATFDIQNGTLRRPTHGNTSWDQAKYEVYGHKFCDISESKFGMAILNNCKYGYSVRDNVIGLSLLKAPKFPDHLTDMCLEENEHKEFIYSAFPHEKALVDSNVFKEAFALNTPLQMAIIQKPENPNDFLDLQKNISNLQFIEIDHPNVAIGALKKSEDGKFYVLRIHQDRGEQVTTIIKFGHILGIRSVKQIDSLENDDFENVETVKTNYEFDPNKNELKEGSNPNANSNSQVPVNFSNIVDFLKDHQRQIYTRETEWLFEKSQMQQRINQLEGQLHAQENINQDLIKRIKMLEFSLRQERVKYAKLASGNSNIGNTDIIGSVLQKANLNTNLYDKIAKRRAKAQRPLLLKFLQEIGYEDIFNTEEINEIKALYEKAQEEMKENLNNPNYQQELEEKLLQDENLKREIMQEEKKDSSENQNKQENQLMNELTQINSVKRELSAKYYLRSHLDIVRGLLFVPEIDTLASISEDCTLKLWSLKGLDKLYQETDGNPEPYITIRGHTGPLFSVTGPHSTYSKIIFTAGNEGIIRAFNLPSINEVNQYGDTYDGKNYCIAQWSEQSGETFWDIKHHPYSNIMLSVSASQKVLVWNTNDLQIDNQDNQGKILNQFNLQGSQLKNQYPFQDVPTCCAWLENQHTNFAVGYRSSVLAFFDNQTGQQLNHTQLFPHNSQNPYHNQINQVTSHSSMSIVACAHENGALSLFDYNSNKIVKTIQDAHFDSLSSVSFSNSSGGLSIITGAHDGSIKIWDLRNYQNTGEIQRAHGKKYDEGVMCIASHSKIPFFATGGADCNINIYELNHQ